MRPLLIAHRCGPSIYPEQSVASAQYALRCHADMVEMDVQFTSEGVPVICHDLNTERVFGVDCLVRDMSYETFMALRHVKDRSMHRTRWMMCCLWEWRRCCCTRS